MNASLLLPAKLQPTLQSNFLHPSRQKPSSSSSSSSATLTKHPDLEPLKDQLIRLAERGRLGDAVAALDRAAHVGIPADPVAYAVLLRSCIRSRDLPHGRRLHRRLLGSGLELDSVLFNCLLTLYSKCGEWDVAFELFDEMGSRKDLVSWTTMISSAVQSGMDRTAISMFCEMLGLGFIPNEYTFCGVIRACSSPEHAWVGRVVLGFVIKMGFWGLDVSVGSTLIDMFAKTREFVSARKVFDGMVERNLVVWTQMITRYAQHGFGKDAIDLFLDMSSDGFEPDRFTISSVISACTELGSLQFGRQLHSLALRMGLACDVCVGCSLVDMYAKCSTGGLMDDSRRVFDRMPEHNVMSWTAVISGYVQSGGHDEGAIRLFCEMIQGMVRPNHFTYSCILKACANLLDAGIGAQVYAHVVKSGIASVNVVGNSLVSMYSRLGRVEEARKAFDVLYEKNMISWNVIVDGYVKNSNSKESFELLQQMDSMDIGVNAFTFASLLSAAANIGIMGKGQLLHAQLIKAGFESDRCIGNALVSMYARCGNLEDACQVFNEMGDRNVISWTSMITGFAKHGHGDRALELFHDMVSSGAKPNEVTYVAVLSACSHVGLVRDGWEHFKSMQRDYGIIPRMEHYACMVDLLGRSGALEEAIEFINSMPSKADALVWRTLLAACRIHGNMALGEKAARHILELEPNDPAAYVLLSNLHAMAGQWEEVGKIRSGMKERKLNKEAGFSWIEIENSIHKFHVGDTSHLQAQEIFAKLDELVEKIRKMGYVPDTNFVLHDVEDELKEQYLFQHSEKIAVAFGLISTSAPRPIRVFKNLRVCGDCHTAIKFISKATGREIILRDSNRFHRMQNGDCSCGEYW